MILALAGQSKSGKDTAADFIVKGKKYHKIAFADNLKEMCKEVFDLTDAQVYTQEGKEKKLQFPIYWREEEHGFQICKWIMIKNGIDLSLEQCRDISDRFEGWKFKSPREILQYVGSELMREHIDPDIHALIVKKVIDSKKWKNVVITDCRFPNERAIVQQWGGQVALIKRNTQSVKKDVHQSENMLESDMAYDSVIENNGSLEDLKENVMGLFSKK